MDIRKVKKLIELLEESGIAEIEIKEGEESVRISRQSPAPVHTIAAPMHAPPLAMAAPAAAPARPAAAAAVPAHSPDKVITAPMVGTFYSAPRPGPSRSSSWAARSSLATCSASSRR
jgi:acetyl-CoA carboxylase biotin carboxyl carrier protein